MTTIESWLAGSSKVMGFLILILPEYRAGIGLKCRNKLSVLLKLVGIEI